MRCVILAGGFAKRLWPLTLDRPKALLDIGGRALLDYIVDGVECLKDVSEIIISTNAAFEPVFREWLGKRNFSKSVRLVVEPSQKEGEKFGAIRGLRWLLEQSKIDDDCLIIHGDNLYDLNLADLVSAYKKTRAPTLALYDVGDRVKARLYGVVKLDGTRITEFQEKPAAPNSTLVATGCYILPRTALKTIDEYLASGNSGDSPGYFISWLAKHAAFHGFVWNGSWFDIGDFASLETAKRWVSKRK